MPSVDDRLHHAFDALDDAWVHRAPPARDEVLSRHHRRRVVRRSAAAVLAAACLVVAVSVVDGEPRTRGLEPAEPVPTSSAPASATPLEGTWISDPLGPPAVRDAARRAGSPDVADAMLEALPDGRFRVVVVVQGANLRTSVRSTGTDDLILDKGVISTTGTDVELRPLTVSAVTTHRFRLLGDRLTMTFRSTTEGVIDGVPGEAWQRLLYDSGPFRR